MTTTKFELGQIVQTRGVLAAIPLPGLLYCISRHRKGDWGEVDAHDKAANNRAVTEGTRLLSAYTVNGVKIWVITEADRSSTTVLLPEEY